MCPVSHQNSQLALKIGVKRSSELSLVLFSTNFQGRIIMLHSPQRIGKVSKSNMMCCIHVVGTYSNLAQKRAAEDSLVAGGADKGRLICPNYC